MQNVKQLRRPTKSQLTDKCWAVIADHYISLDLTHADARREASDLRARKQRGVAIITNEAARKLVSEESDALIERAA